MEPDKKSGIKSAYELAMERLEQRHGRSAPATAEQKAALADVDRDERAKLAELDIMTSSQLAAARAAGDEKKAAEIAEFQARESATIRRRAEESRDRIRNG